MRVFFLGIMLCLPYLSQAQTRMVRGTVTDSISGEALPGATVCLADTSGCVAANAEGQFQIPVTQEAESLLVQFIGMESKLVVLGSTDMVNVSLTASNTELQEAVVTAYNIRKQKKEIGYAIQEVQGEAIISSREPNLVSALAGKVAGAQIVSSAGTPGASSYIRIRGNSSITGNGQPLFVIDGVPVDNSFRLSTGNAISDLGGPAFSNRLIDINPDDIKTMTVLKGPAASALYGTRAAGGAIIITTRKGTKGPLRISYSSSLSVDRVNALPELQNTYAQGFNGRYREGHPSSWGPRLDSLRYDGNGEIVRFDDSTSTGRAVTPFDNLGDFFQSGHTANNSISFSGGDDNSTYYASISNLTQQGVVPESSYGRTSLRLTGSTGLSGRLQVSGSALYSHSGGRRAQQGSNEAGILVGLLRTPPSYDNANGTEHPVDNEDAYYNPDRTQRSYTASFDNPWYSVNENVFTDDVNRLNGYMLLDYRFAPWLSASYRLGTDLYTEKRHQSIGIGSRRYAKGRVYEEDNTSREVNSNLLLTFTKRISRRLQSSLLLGNNLNRRQFSNTYVQGDNLTIPQFYQLSNASSITAAQYDERRWLTGAFGQLKLAYRDMLFLELTGRNDWASTFGDAGNSFFYPAVSASFVFTELLKDGGSDIFPFGQLRASYAQAGREPDPYLTQTTYVSPSYGGGFIGTIQFPFNGVNGFTLSNTAGNGDLRPEVTTSYEVGTALYFFKKRIKVDLTRYSAESSDQILPVTVAPSTGFTALVGNAGKVTNKGIELMLSGKVIDGREFSWNVAVNYARNRSKVVELAPDLEQLNISSNFLTAKTINIAGAPYGALYGTRWARNSSGALIIDDDTLSPTYGFPTMAATDSIIGDPNPDWIGSISNELVWHNWSLSFLIDIKKGGDIWNGTRGILNHYGVSKETEVRDSEKVFEGVKASDGSANDIVAVLDQDWYQGPASGFEGPSEQYVEDASWTRLRQVTIAYSFPMKNSKTISGIQVSAYGRNLILLTGFDGIDPETNLKGADSGQGLSYFNMPNTKSYGLALKIDL